MAQMTYEQAMQYYKHWGDLPPHTPPEHAARFQAENAKAKEEAARAEARARTPSIVEMQAQEAAAAAATRRPETPGHGAEGGTCSGRLSLDQLRDAATGYGYVLIPAAEHEPFLEWRRTRDPAECRPTGLTCPTGPTSPTSPIAPVPPELTLTQVDTPPVAQASSLPGRQDACATDVAASAVDNPPNITSVAASQVDDLARFVPCDLPPLPADDPYMAILRSGPLADTCTEADQRMQRDILAEESAILREELTESLHFNPAAPETPPRRPAKVWKKIFLQVFSECGTIELAAHKAGVTRACVYKARRTDKRFAAAWTVAMDEALDVLECEAHKRAREKSDRLMMWILSRRRPAVWGDPNAEKCGRDDKTSRRARRTNVARQHAAGTV